MEVLHTHIPVLRDKIQLLLKEQATLIRETQKLREQVAAQHTDLEQLRQDNVKLEQQVNILKTAAGQMDETARKQFERRINQYIKDIDQVIAHLDQ